MKQLNISKVYASAPGQGDIATEKAQVKRSKNESQVMKDKIASRTACRK